MIWAAVVIGKVRTNKISGICTVLQINKIGWKLRGNTSRECPSASLVSSLNDCSGKDCGAIRWAVAFPWFTRG